MKKKLLIVVGHGGHSKVITSIAKESNYNKIVKIKLKISKNNNLTLNNKARINKILKMYPSYEINLFVAVGLNFIRKKIFDFLWDNFKKKVNFPILISKNSFIHDNVKIGKGSVIMPGVVINANSHIGKQCIINSSSSIDHDCIISSFVSLGPGVITGGNVKIGSMTHIGIGTNINHNLKIGSNIVIGSSSLVNTNCISNFVYYGIPIKKIRKREIYDDYLNS